MIKSQKGITLVALIITIIVMLILAGVSISLVLDEGGVLKQAQKTEGKQVEGALREAVALANADLIAEFYSDTSAYMTSSKTDAERIEDAITRNCKGYTLRFEGTDTTEGTVIADGIYYNDEGAAEEVNVTFSIDTSKRYIVIEAN